MISEINGVGAVRKAAFNSVGVFEIEDLLRYYPRGYQHRGDVRLLCDGNVSEYGAFVLTVASEPQVRLIRRGMSLMKFKAFDESGVCEITYFNQNYLKERFSAGGAFRFWGKLGREGNRYSLNSPVAEVFNEDIPLAEFIPVYPLATGLTQKFVSQCVSTAIKKLLDLIADPMPDSVRKEYGLCTFKFAVQNIHNPVDAASLETARKRLMFEEIFLFALSLSILKKKRLTFGANVMSDSDVSPLLALQPYSLTSAQKRVIDDVARDMNSEAPMSRIIVGDVGCGKTICAAAAAFIAAKNGYQTAFMAPTEILARQHYDDLMPMFQKLGIGCVLLTGSISVKQKKKIREMIEMGDGISPPPCLVIGTHALLEDNVKFSKLGLVITDEQHRFGVMQRAALADKSKSAHVLVMSATPIPRTLSLIMYGDLDVSQIDEMPAGRQKVDTFVVSESYRERLNGFIRKQVHEGNQVYIVCPSIESEQEEKSEDDIDNFTDFDPAKVVDTGTDLNLKAAVTYALELSRDVFPDLRVGFVHGKLKGADKEAVMSEFCAGNIDILVSTTVIEVGVNVPSATLMIVENADRFGLSQLHQLRGRVGRGMVKSYCILVSDSKSETALERLDVMKKTNDGYVIAEKDLALRGPGDLFGSGNEIKQHGGMNFKFAGQCSDMDMLHSAFDAARAIAKNDPELIRPEYQGLKKQIESMYQKNANTLN